MTESFTHFTREAAKALRISNGFTTGIQQSAAGNRPPFAAVACMTRAARQRAHAALFQKSSATRLQRRRRLVLL